MVLSSLLCTFEMVIVSNDDPHEQSNALSFDPACAYVTQYRTFTQFDDDDLWNISPHRDDGSQKKE